MPWDDGNPKVNFGGTDYGDIVGLSGQIRTFNEQMEDKVQLDEIRQRVADAKRIVFLGFHFHNQNMELLKAPGPNRGDIVNAYTTAYDRSNADVALIDGRYGICSLSAAARGMCRSRSATAKGCSRITLQRG